MSSLTQKISNVSASYYDKNFSKSLVSNKSQQNVNSKNGNNVAGLNNDQVASIKNLVANVRTSDNGVAMDEKKKNEIYMKATMLGQLLNASKDHLVNAERIKIVEADAKNKALINTTYGYKFQSLKNSNYEKVNGILLTFFVQLMERLRESGFKTFVNEAEASKVLKGYLPSILGSIAAKLITCHNEQGVYQMLEVLHDTQLRRKFVVDNLGDVVDTTFRGTRLKKYPEAKALLFQMVQDLFEEDVLTHSLLEQLENVFAAVGDESLKKLCEEVKVNVLRESEKLEVQ